MADLIEPKRLEKTNWPEVIARYLAFKSMGVPDQGYDSYENRPYPHQPEFQGFWMPRVRPDIYSHGPIWNRWAEDDLRGRGKLLPSKPMIRNIDPFSKWKDIGPFGVSRDSRGFIELPLQNIRPEFPAWEVGSI